MDKVVHFEIPFDNQDRAKKFYQSIFGWQMQEMPEMNYISVRTVDIDERRMPKEPGAINGGMMKRDDTAKTPVLVIDVSSIDDYLKKIETAGGKQVMPKVSIGNMGYYARVTDTEGNVIGLWETIPQQ